jgi:hypothetical protein
LAEMLLVIAAFAMIVSASSIRHYNILYQISYF